MTTRAPTLATVDQSWVRVAHRTLAQLTKVKKAETHQKIIVSNQFNRSIFDVWPTNDAGSDEANGRLGRGAEGEEGLQHVLGEGEGDHRVGGRVDDEQGNPEEEKGRQWTESLEAAERRIWHWHSGWGWKSTSEMYT